MSMDSDIVFTCAAFCKNRGLAEKDAFDLYRNITTALQWLPEDEKAEKNALRRSRREVKKEWEYLNK